MEQRTDRIMKLIYCKNCHDLFVLRFKMRICECGKTKGRYLNNSLAEVSKDAISVALGNGSFDMAIARMLALQQQSSDTAERKDYIEKARINYAWIRPNTGMGNPHTIILDERKVREVVYIKTNLLLFSNNKVEIEKVERIAKNIKPEKFKALPVCKTDKGYILTDGNHRAKAAIKAGIDSVPCVILTKKEFDYIAYSKTRTYDFTGYVPEVPRIITKL